MNTEIKSNSGTAVSAHEQGRNDVANGLKSNDPEMVRRGVQQIKRALEMDTQNIEGSAGPDIKGQYREQGGEYDVNRMIPQPAGGKQIKQILQNSRTGHKKIIYTDGTEEIQ